MSDERARLDEVSCRYARPPDQRQAPEIPIPATWRDVLQRAFLVNGELEAAYNDWAAAVARVDQAATWPNSNLAFGYAYMFSGGRLTGWDRTTITLQPDPAMNLQLPIKARQAGRLAFQEARAAGFRLLTRKFDLQRRVLLAYYDLALQEERIRIQRENVDLLNLLSPTTEARVAAGASLQDLLKIQIELVLAENELGNLVAEARSVRATLNGLLARPPEASLVLPNELPSPRAVLADDARLIALGVEQNPELASLAAEVAGRCDALELARLRYLPDINPQIAVSGLAQTVGVMAMLPTTLPAIRGAIEEARDMVCSADATLRQTKFDRSSSFVAALFFFRNAERQTELLQGRVLPLAREAMTTSEQAYAAGKVSFADLIDSQRRLLDVRLAIAEARMTRERRLAELESLAGADIETLGGAANQPMTQPASQPVTQPATGSATTEPAWQATGL